MRWVRLVLFLTRTSTVRVLQVAGWVVFSRIRFFAHAIVPQPFLSARIQRAPGPCCNVCVPFVSQVVESPGTVAASAVSILAVIGILVVSTGSMIRSNQGNRSGGTSGGGPGASGGGSATTGGGSGASGGGGGGPEGSSGSGSRGLPGMVGSLARWESFLVLGWTKIWRVGIELSEQVAPSLVLTLVPVQATEAVFASHSVISRATASDKELIRSTPRSLAGVVLHGRLTHTSSCSQLLSPTPAPHSWVHWRLSAAQAGTVRTGLAPAGRRQRSQSCSWHSSSSWPRCRSWTPL